ncbi:hypothetical protein QTI24_06580 [Variovorax sp. J22P240]|uniref:hypothetical protein n=1 Tax=Variovorax sp. J22P240 TaxID=3053514 RepID=UPI0025765EB8|nr:hypothetical protein [Variovorax sp. J22P240]MDL9998261.1 hypothetical protein [Variovorax sp. J22P240]
MQVLAALYIVVQAWRTTRALSTYKRITIDNTELIVGQIAEEMRGQFKHQLAGFTVLAIGAALQALAGL